MSQFVHHRHKPPVPLARERELIVACPPLRSNINLARIMRAASCSGVRKMVVCGNPKIDVKIARDALEQIELEHRRTLPPALKNLAADGYKIVGLEQTSGAARLPDFVFERRTVLVVGHERTGLADDLLEILDAAVEIPVFGLPYSYNVATATAMALYEYCRQFPDG